MLRIEVEEGEFCSLCREPGSPDRPMLVLIETRRGRDKDYLEFHLECWQKVERKAAKAITAYALPKQFTEQ